MKPHQWSGGPKTEHRIPTRKHVGRRASSGSVLRNTIQRLVVPRNMQDAAKLTFFALNHSFPPQDADQ
jgi:hypothetical protein